MHIYACGKIAWHAIGILYFLFTRKLCLHLLHLYRTHPAESGVVTVRWIEGMHLAPSYPALRNEESFLLYQVRSAL